MQFYRHATPSGSNVFPGRLYLCFNMFGIISLKNVCAVIFVFISFCSIGQERNAVKELYHPRSPKTLKQALRHSSKAKSVQVIYAYSDSIFPSEQMLALKNVENISVFRPYFSTRARKKAKRGEVTLKPYPTVRIDTIALKQLSHLKYLQFVNVDFENFPIGICCLRQLKGLAIALSSVDTIPKELGKMTNLIALGLSLNNIRFLPKEIMKLDSLRYLDLANNAFETIPSELLQMQNLETIDLSNKEQSFEDTLGINWPIVIHTNKITYLPNLNVSIDPNKPTSKKGTTIFLGYGKKITLRK